MSKVPIEIRQLKDREWKTVRCTHCSAQYTYAQSYLDEEDKICSHWPAACPGCGTYQPDMILGAKGHIATTNFMHCMIGGFLFLFLGEITLPICAVMGLSNSESSYSTMEIVIYHVIFAGPVFIILASSHVRRLLVPKEVNTPALMAKRVSRCH